MTDICESGNLMKSHVMWKMKFKISTSFGDKFNTEIINKSNFCTLGKWLHSEKIYSKFSHLDSYLDCVKQHELFHIEASKLAKLSNDSKSEEALLLLDDSSSAFNLTSAAVTASISKLLLDLDNLNALNKKIVEI